MTTFNPGRVYVYAEVPATDGRVMVMEWAFEHADLIQIDADLDTETDLNGVISARRPCPPTYALTVRGVGRGRIVMRMPERPETPAAIEPARPALPAP